ncbi:hypothetical protein D3C71_1211480 [compost metagenome]
MGADQFARHTLRLQVEEFALGHGHFLGVGRQPQRAVAAIGTGSGQVCGLFAPTLQ